MGDTLAVNLPALGRLQPVYFLFLSLHRPVFLVNSPSHDASCVPPEAGGASLEITPSCFAEFLKLPSLALLGLLDLPTCVGYRYDLKIFSLRSFSRISKSPVAGYLKGDQPHNSSNKHLYGFSYTDCFAA